MEWSRVVKVNAKERVEHENYVTVNASSRSVQLHVLTVKNKTGKYQGLGYGPTKNRGKEGIKSGQTSEINRF